ncbi:MAG: YraN family protein [Halothiobacillus sp. 24-54-40]|nr:YraN family protein [Halothiobacillaceae bacterium]OYV47162.1 MAG: YraN family protein [Halothiobacillus sp. 20-53-49]OYY34487.1 MAG: YraN family protein [Halothiobacillus sp. 35-54-62]OYZ86219.1 MAG: YraN family protein [Halothiobacillus sp. 24-54-40]OZA79870.1 MAG: YraN family protein [Halothiobacillus sp. 39-53-45]HQS03119.1 YraN family protein [Halothiobacillus sp.]
MRGKNALAAPQTPHERSPTCTVARGYQAETDAANYLLGQGLQLIDRNVRAGRGEIDLIMQQGNTLVFVEVRARKAQATISAVESISRSKRLKVIETAERLLMAHPAWQTRPCRFDVVGIAMAQGDQPAQLEWIVDAFQAE